MPKKWVHGPFTHDQDRNSFTLSNLIEQISHPINQWELQLFLQAYLWQLELLDKGDHKTFRIFRFTIYCRNRGYVRELNAKSCITYRAMPTWFGHAHTMWHKSGTCQAHCEHTIHTCTDTITMHFLLRAQNSGTPQDLRVLSANYTSFSADAK